MPKHYKSKEAYDKSMAFIHIHDIPHDQHKYDWIAGKKHYPKHSKKESKF